MTIEPSKRVCIVCQEDDERILMEAHHVFSKGNSPETIILCHNCHDKITHDQQLLPPKVRSKKASKENRDDVEYITVGSLLELIGKRLKERGLDGHRR
jgi:hypothetical protein